MMRQKSINQLAVEWAIVGNQQQLTQWQLLEWDEVGKIIGIATIPTDATVLRQQAKGKLALPGFVNAHAHLALYTQQAIALLPEESMGDWLLKVVKTSQETTESTPNLIAQGIQEALATGTTTIASTVRNFSDTFKALDKTPAIRSVWLLEWFHPSNAVSESRIEALQDALNGTAFYLKSLPANVMNRTYLGFSPHSPYNVSLQAWQALKQAFTLEEKTVLWQTHLLESTEEALYYQKNRDASNRVNSIDTVHQTLLGQTFEPKLPIENDIVASLDSFELLEPNLSVVHGLELSIEQAEVLANAGVALVTCPRSNQFLHEKVLSEWLLWHPNLTIAVGTDGHVSLPSPTVLDMRLELQALKHVYPWLSWELLLRMATVNGAKALGLAGQVGELTVGAWADVVVWGLPEETHHQLEALLATALNTTAPPQAVFVAGCPV